MNEDIHRSRLGIFGGSFDPPHDAHLAIARAAQDRHRLNPIIFVPNRIPPHKGAHASPEDRYTMVLLAIEGASGFEATDREVRRRGKSYTLDTLREFRSEGGESTDLFFIVGADTLPELPTWRGFRDIASLARIVVVGRARRPIDVAVSLTGTVPDSVVRQIESDVIPGESSEISSSGIRKRVRDGRSLDGWTTAAVARYIEEKSLYREGEDH